jgi:hypothetical protein
VTGLSCHRHRRIWLCLRRSGRQCLRRLDAGVEASGPHDFAVRSTRLRQRLRRALSASPPKFWRRRKAPFVSALGDRSRETRPAIPSRAQRCRVHRIPSRVRDDRASAPLRDGTSRDIELIWVRREGKFFCKRGWTAELPNSPSGKSADLTVELTMSVLG